MCVCGGGGGRTWGELMPTCVQSTDISTYLVRSKIESIESKSGHRIQSCGSPLSDRQNNV